MTLRDAPLRFLSLLALGAATGWRDLGKTSYLGELSVDTDHSLYRFHNGVFVSRSKKPERYFDAPASMRGLLLVGFLHEDDAADRWSCTTAWRVGAHAVLWRLPRTDPSSFVLTSPTASFFLESPPAKDPEPSPWLGRRTPGASGVVKVQRRIVARPPSIRLPLPPSMTRLHPSGPPSER